MATKIVTRDSLQAMIDQAPPEKVMHIVGRALLVLLANQTAEERAAEHVIEDNGIGFTGSDGPFGTGTAKFYSRMGKLSEKQLWRWTRKNDRGYSRIAKYHAQLNRAAEIRAGKA